jgi:crossover junction endodeoxyribonuclease RuvC
MAGTVVCAIDPGLEGGIALYDWAGQLQALDMPTVGEKARRQVNAAALAHLLRSAPVSHGVIERASSMPRQGVAGVFRYGAAYGSCLGVLGALEISVHTVSPSVWKRDMGLDPSKENSRLRIISLFPEHEKMFARKRDHNRAEAALLAVWYIRHRLLRGEE